jgi:glutaredoxin
MNRSPILMLVAAVLALPAAAQTIYRWVDKDGKVQFSDTPPPESAKGVTQQRGSAGEVETDLPFASREAARRNPVAIFVAKGCGEPCQQARELLRGRGVPYAERDPMVNQGDADALVKLVGKLEVPVITVGSNHVAGFEAGQWQAALDAAGYPRSLPPGVRAPSPRSAVADRPAIEPATQPIEPKKQ